MGFSHHFSVAVVVVPVFFHGHYHFLDTEFPGPLPGDAQRLVHVLSAGPLEVDGLSFHIYVYYNQATVLRSVPTPSTLISMVSPDFIGPMPAGVPVAITSPANRVINWEI